MQKIRLLIFLIGCTVLATAQAQQSSPQGMKYQAIARNLSGGVLANQAVTLKITLSSRLSQTATTHYSEIHAVTTNAFGLFDLVVGQGTVELGVFNQVPWSSEDIWMEIGIRDAGRREFTAISNSRLLAVPYAFHAVTAGELTGGGQPRANALGAQASELPAKCQCEGGIAQVRLLYTGGTGSVKVKAYSDDNLKYLLGTFNNVKSGDILTVNAEGYPDKKLKNNTFLKVEGAGPAVPLVNLPTECDVAVVGESFGNFSVLARTDRKNNLECTVCDVRVDWKVGGNGLQNLCNQLGTKNSIDLVFITNNTERLRISKAGDLSISNGLNVGMNVDVGNDLIVRKNVFLNTTGGSTTNNGPFQVTNLSPARLTGTLLVEKDGTFKQKVVLDNALLGSTSTGTGALVVAGGVGIGQNLNVGGTARVMDATESLSTTSGALTVTGGVGVGKRLNVLGATNLNSILTVSGITTLNNKLTVGDASDLNGQVTISANTPGTDQDDYNNYPLRVQGNEQGIAVKLTASTPLPGNNFITFFNSSGVAKGRIEGSGSIGDNLRSAIINLVSTPDIDAALGASQDKNAPGTKGIPAGLDELFSSDYAFGAYQLTLDLVNDIVRLIINVVGASAVPCVSGDCDDAIWSAVDVAVGALQLGGYITYNELQSGVAFESGGADYAEWLLKANPKETFVFGEVVGVKGGVFSKTFTDAEKFMVVSSAPAIIGGMPEKKKLPLYEKIAFMGQVPVKVLGRVRKGNYLLPSGKGDGMAMAVEPANMSALDYRRIIGIAWADSDPKKAFNYINAAVGLNTNDLASTVDQMQMVINEMQLALQKAVPDYKPRPFAVSGKNAVAANNPTGYSTAPAMREVIKSEVASKGYANIQEAMQEVKQYMGAQGVDLKQYPYMTELLDNPTPEVARKAQAHYMNVLARAQTLMAQQQKR